MNVVAAEVLERTDSELACSDRPCRGLCLARRWGRWGPGCFRFVCDWCGNAIEEHKSLYMHEDGVFCGERCRRAADARHHTPRGSDSFYELARPMFSSFEPSLRKTISCSQVGSTSASSLTVGSGSPLHDVKPRQQGGNILLVRVLGGVVDALAFAGEEALHGY